MSIKENPGGGRAWTTQEMIASASNWSLAGDAGLLKHLELFSENLLRKAEDTNNNLNTLLENLNSSSLSLDILKNEFRSLQNVQFIESRVYEEDETLPVNEQLKATGKEVSEQERMTDIKEAVLEGINVVNKYFDKVEVPGSDSEDETDFPSFVLRPKDPYCDRPLPYVIGSEDWHKKWHIGLVDSSSESEAENISDEYSDSDVEDNLSNKNFSNIAESVTSSRIINQPVANSTFDDMKPEQNLFGLSDSEESLSVQPPVSNKSFADELASKLVSVAERDLIIGEPEINKRPIQKPASNKVVRNAFLDEPPSTDEEDDMFGKKPEDGLFSKNYGLFDDLNEGFSDEDDLFNNSNTKHTVENVNSSKIPVGGINILGNTNLFQQQEIDALLKKARKQSTSEATIDNDDIVEENKINESIGKVEQSSNLFGATETNKNANTIKDDTFKVDSDTSIEKNKEPISLFDTTDLFDDDLFSNTPYNKYTSALFEDELFRDDVLEITHKLKDSVIGEAKTNIGGVANEDLDNSVFLHSESDDSFSINTSKAEKQKVPETVKESKSKDTLNKSASQLSFFDQNPPPDDDGEIEWGAKLEANVFDDNVGLFDNIPEISTQRSELFDHEPPLLFSESSGIVRDASDRMETDDSFNPYASSSRRYSSDIFNEEQSNDCLFITKSKSQVDSQPNLKSIPEIPNAVEDAYSIVDITPSGNLDSLFGDSTIAIEDILHKKNTITYAEVSPIIDSPDFDIFADSDKVFVDLDISKEVTKPAVPTKPSSSPPKPSVIGEKDFGKVDIVSPGKIKHELNINVQALLPGSSPQRKKNPEKLETNKDAATEADDELFAVMSKSISNSKTTTKKSDQIEDSRLLVDSLDDSSASIGILPSVTKDRVRIPVKRRPSTRKARHESIRNSVPDFKIVTSPEYEDENDDKTPQFSTSIQAIDKKSISISSDDLFSLQGEEITQNDISKTVVKKSVKPVNIPEINIQSASARNQEKNNVHDLFNDLINATSVKKESSILNDPDLFDDRDDFDDIFATRKLPPKYDISKKSFLSDTLYGEEDDDDLFGLPSASFKQPDVSTEKNKIGGTIKKSSKIKKLKNTTAVEDPLSLFDDAEDI